MAPVCFVEGTRILTVPGEVAVEDLREGDEAVLFGGQAAPIKWIGWRTVPARLLAQEPANAPIRIVAGAFGPGRPHRDLLISGDHAVAAHGVLIPARLLINDLSIVPDETPRDITYYHVELHAHGLLQSEGLATESFLEADANRSFFANGPQPTDARPNLSTVAYEARSCLPRVYGGPVVDEVRRLLLGRSAQLGALAPPLGARTAA